MDKDKEIHRIEVKLLPLKIFQQITSVRDILERYIISRTMRKSTPKQKAAVKYCEEWLNIEFEGNIDSYNDCHYFLMSYLEDAKQLAMELSCEFEAYMWN